MERSGGAEPIEPRPAEHDATAEREQAFWDEHVQSLRACLAEFHRGPDPNTAAMLASVEPLAGLRALDFACGAGVTSAWLAARGGIVTGIDLSPHSISRARELAGELGLPIEFVVGELGPDTFAPGSFDVIVGRYALHHVDLRSVAPALAGVLAPGGRGAFVETMGLNPLLNFARAHVAGRAGVVKLGSEDERPLRREDLAILGAAFGKVELEVAQLTFLRIFDRNVLKFRSRRTSHAAARIDRALLRAGLGRLSFHQVVKVTKTAGA